VILIDRHAIDTTSLSVSSRLFYGLGRIVTILAKRLPIVLVPEQFFVSLVRFDMINDCCYGYSTNTLTIDTQWVYVEEYKPCLSPLP
jgi:hypothetical protein